MVKNLFRMTIPFKITIFPATISDSKEIYDLQLLAFSQQALIYKTDDLPALTETLSSFEDTFPQYTYLKAVNGKKIIGAVRAYEKNYVCYIERLIVHPEFQNKGLGKLMMKRIEDKFDSVNKFDIFTGHLSRKNIRLYESIGYKIYKEEYLNDFVNIVHMCKNHQR
jgi:ribosomal protein S18 acetylase RimI-like enzyme